jgi:hypothetical protein
MVKLFDIQNGTVVPTEHCYTLLALKQVMVDYPDNYLTVYCYIFYMTCPNPDLNPFFDAPENEKEDLIISQLNIDFSTEDDTVQVALAFCTKMYETPTFRAYMGIKSMLDRLAVYLEHTAIEHGRDGNINSMVNVAAKFELIRSSFKGAFKDLKEEQKSTVRGNQHLGYDQM